MVVREKGAWLIPGTFLTHIVIEGRRRAGGLVQ